ncbi:MAG: asparagine synthase-related protein [Crocinitomicaceae bacterium]|nr:asparagine synthase-related protein [Crocinitomicaceae bacterium]
MILGSFSFNPASLSNQQELYKYAVECIQPASSIKTGYSKPRLNLTIFSHPNFPKSKRDNYCVNEDENVIVLVVGHIFNLNELSIDSSESASSTILNQYEQDDLAFLDRLNGEFSICILDLKVQKCILIRDALGIIPLTLAKKDDVYYFSSDTHGLGKSLFGEEPISKQYLISRFYDYERNFHFCPNGNMQKVFPGTYLEITNSAIEQKNYWNPEEIPEKANINFLEATNHLSELLDDAIKVRSKDFAVGTHVSGGLDSSLITVRAKKLLNMQKELHAFTWSPSQMNEDIELAYDERISIRNQCEKSGIQLHFTNVTTEDYHAFVSSWRFPSEHFFERRLTMNAVSQKVNLLLSGWGGDEFIGVPDEALYAELLRKGKLKQFNWLNREQKFRKLAMNVVNKVLFPKRRRVFLKNKMHPENYHYMCHKSVTNRLSPVEHQWHTSKRSHQLSMIEYQHLSQRCEDWYLHGQHIGIEYAYPLMDKRIVEYCIGLPSELFVGKTMDRPLMRALGKDQLIDEIRLLPKSWDHAVMKNAISIQRDCLKEYIEDWQQLKNEEELDFIDFGAIERELEVSNEISKRLGIFFYYLKSTDEYIKNYRQRKID